MNHLRKLVAVTCLAFAPAAQAELVTLTHVHGLAYSADGKKLMIPSHHGLAVYEGGTWSKAPGPEHDYMGFSATARHLYSSGHPAHGLGLVNPFGLIRSKDGGRSWDKLGLEGETDFHVLGPGWNTDAVYVWNPAPSSRIPVAGLHSTRNDGFTWTAAKAAGLQGEPRALAVHPDDPATVALATSHGIFLSRDSGNRFTRVVQRGQGLAVFFDLDGKHLWTSIFDGQPRLARHPLGGGAATAFEPPPLIKDAIAYIAQNPVARLEYAIATFGRSVYLSKDAGRHWSQIAERGEAR
ncbi:MAG TPA: glycosyl hydrolase [Burkholderiales bacterium]|nr:glycosyl hydrolase [Burkholderiales bacterium]